MKWKVDVKGNYSDGSLEISICKTSFDHGFASYGWFGRDKIPVFNPPSHGCVMSKSLFDSLVECANKECERLNRES